ncbi:hydrogenase nickel incorporation protein HypA/HybF [Halobiforma haloterrestris]|uniref:Hydrogenase maturation factor HypA n=1 Tax=Natronobacterium haloterrestre TaxID=148448 RepID=A0A1I1JL24_NATHA|nr:hydrogenase maturation nickel metallochaperone HypA [Halobiforma haloterrestris]SFC49309.1 hydrogenase nickel incorporation protein HypA/HybF [Halobiforma haloterrestris]
MHEFSVADAVLERALETAADHGTAIIEELTIELGTATHVNPDQLTFCLETIADGTPAADATVTIDPVEPHARCDCGWDGEPPTLDVSGAVAPNLRCPDCGERLELVRGKECRLSSITVPDADSSAGNGDDPMRIDETGD